MSTYEPIASQTLGSAAASVTFSSIPQGYTDLVLVLNSASASVDAFTYLQFNGDTATNYSHTQLYGNGTSAVSSRASNTSTMLNVDVNMETTSIIYNAIYQIQNYSNSTTFKTTLVRQNNTGSDYPGALAGVGLWRNTSPITTITIQATRGGSAYNFVAGSTFSLYGIQVGDKAQKAQGGNIVTSDGTYVYHTFTSSGAFIPSQALTVDYLVVAGGGGGGLSYGGGGGGGGLRSTVTATGGGGSLESALSLSSGKSYPVIVGAGGVGSTSSSINGLSGSNSIFASITSTGGGGGSGQGVSGRAGSTGGAGGGGGASNVTGETNGPGGNGTANQGYAGGNGLATSSGGAAGGGGGAGAVGSNGTAGVGGNGGAGVAVSISGSSITYAGGGGANANGTNGSGGSGGGGAAGNPATSGTVSTGGGGGGSGTTTGNGGSGIVIIRYAI